MLPTYSLIEGSIQVSRIQCSGENFEQFFSFLALFLHISLFYSWRKITLKIFKLNNYNFIYECITYMSSFCNTKKLFVIETPLYCTMYRRDIVQYRDVPHRNRRDIELRFCCTGPLALFRVQKHGWHGMGQK